MTTTNHGNPLHPTRRLRFDATASASTRGPEAAPGRSGRVLVGVGVLTVLAVWLGLYLGFRHWRARFEERRAYGVRAVASAVDPLARIAPPGVDGDDWRQAVAETRAMLVTVTSANVLDLAALRALAAEVSLRVERARARPDTAPAELAALWDDLAARAGHVIDRHPRPKLLRGGDSPQRTQGAQRGEERK